MVATVSGWEDYAEARGDTVTIGANANAALVRAQDYIDYHYCNRFSAAVTVDEAVLDAAVYEAAKLELEAPGFWTKTFTPDQQKVLTQVGDIKWEARDSAGGASAATPVSTKIEGMLRPYLTGAGFFTVPGAVTV